MLLRTIRTGARSVLCGACLVGLVPRPAQSHPTSPQHLVFVTHAAFPVSTVSAEVLRDIFLGRVSRLSEDCLTHPVVNQQPDSHRAFLSFMGKSQRQFIRYWRRLLYTGMSMPPLEFNDSLAALDHVAHTRGAVGYVLEGTELQGAGVHVLTVK